MEVSDRDQLVYEDELMTRMKISVGRPPGTLRRRSPVFFYFFSICAVVFALTVVWTVTRTLGVQWSVGDNQAVYGPAGAGERVLRVRSQASSSSMTEQDRVAILAQRANSTSGLMFMQRPLVVWSNDYHISPIQDLKHTLRPLGVTFIDKSLSNDCARTASCATDLRVLQPETALTLPKEVKTRFQLTYSQDSEMLSVDAFVCFHPTAMCELFMSFNRSLLVIATTRYEMGRLEPDRWAQWNDNLHYIHRDRRNLVAANNLYDAKYIEYFTGIKPLVLPNICDYVKEEYGPKRKGFLLAPILKEGFQDIFLQGFNTSCSKFPGAHCQGMLQSLREVYRVYNYSDLASHQGIVYVPYQVSTMSIFEQYSMGIPLFFPSMDLLAEWHLLHQVLVQRTWTGVNEQVLSKSPLPPHPSQVRVPDPNCDTDIKAIRYWIRYADFYQLPHLIHYDSFDDLVYKLTTTDLEAISAKMKKFTVTQKTEVLQKWRTILYNIAKYSKNKPV